MPRQYTLLELVVVVSILALVMTVAASRLGSGSGRLTLQMEADGAASFLGSAKALAIHQGRRIQVELRDRSLVIAGNDSLELNHPIPAEIELKPQVQGRDGKARLFTFFPDGRGSGSPFRMKLKAHEFELSVSPLSGAVSVKELEE
jgi:type II secretory pathway pseudopilin PulG